MNLKYFGVVSIFFIVTFTCGCFANAENLGQTAQIKKVDPVEEILKTMTLEEKIGQMMIVGVHGTAINTDIRFMLNQYHYGGIILFDRNMESKSQVKSFVEEMQINSNQKLPLFIALDEEGGRVARMKHDLQVMPSQQEIGATGDVELAREYARQTARNLREIGVNLNFAPVADVVSTDSRSFSGNPEVVTNFVLSAAKGYEDENFFYTLKHFPGIGKSKVDPHKALSDITDDKNILEAEDFLPFKKVIAANNNSNFMIMVGHLRYTAVDAENPATISPAIITGILRNEMGFDGVVVTDDLQMGAVNGFTENIGVKSIKAGVDILLVCHEYATQENIYLNVLDAVKRGEISEDRINESVRRILKMKLNFSAK